MKNAIELLMLGEILSRAQAYFMRRGTQVVERRVENIGVSRHHLCITAQLLRADAADG